MTESHLINVTGDVFSATYYSQWTKKIDQLSRTSESDHLGINSGAIQDLVRRIDYEIGIGGVIVSITSNTLKVAPNDLTVSYGTHHPKQIHGRLPLIHLSETPI